MVSPHQDAGGKRAKSQGSQCHRVDHGYGAFWSRQRDRLLRFASGTRKITNRLNKKTGASSMFFLQSHSLRSLHSWLSKCWTPFHLIMLSQMRIAIQTSIWHAHQLVALGPIFPCDESAQFGGAVSARLLESTSLI